MERSSSADSETIIASVVPSLAVLVLVVLLLLYYRRRAPAAEEPFKFPEADGWEFDRSNLLLGEELGDGEFGVVLQGKAIGIDKNEAETIVAVKMVKTDHVSDEVGWTDDITMLYWTNNLLASTGQASVCERSRSDETLTPPTHPEASGCLLPGMTAQHHSCANGSMGGALGLPSSADSRVYGQW